MVPTSAGAALAFLLLVAPGVAFELVRQQSRPPRTESVFIEISRVLLAGLLLTVLSVTLLALAAGILGAPLVDLAAWIREGNVYAHVHLPLAGMSIAIELAVALLLAIVLHDLLKPAGARQVVHESGWHTAFSRIAPPGTEVYLSVQLKDGTTVTGYRADYSTESDPAKRELTLRPPLTMRAPNASQAVPLSDEWQRLLLHGAEILTIAVTYVGARAPVPAPGLRRKAAKYRWQLALFGVVVILAALSIAGLR
jgi:hypothetical protein